MKMEDFTYMRSRHLKALLPGLLIAVFGVVNDAYGGIVFNNFGADPAHLYDGFNGWVIDCSGRCTGPGAVSSQITEAMPFTPSGNWVWMLTQIDVAVAEDLGYDSVGLTLN